MQIARDIACRLGPPAFFRQPDSVFAGDNAAPLQDLREELIQRALDFLTHRSLAIVTVGHDVDMHVAITGMTKTGDRKSVLAL